MSLKENYCLTKISMSLGLYYIDIGKMYDKKMAKNLGGQKWSILL